MLKAENETKQYGSQTAVNGVSLELEDNAVTVIVGESGSGKSTLARILSLIEKPDSGRILLDDTEADRRYAKANRRFIQLVMQNAASSLDPHGYAERYPRSCRFQRRRYGK